MGIYDRDWYKDQNKSNEQKSKRPVLKRKEFLNGFILGLVAGIVLMFLLRVF